LAIEGILIILNKLKAGKVIQDYAIAGGYASMYYEVPMASYDLDVLVLLSSEEDYHKLYEYFRKAGAKIENVYIYIDDMPVQFLPNFISPLYNSAVEDALLIDFNGIQSKFVSAEYLILLFLTAFRDKDKIRIRYLLDKVDKDLLLSLIERFNNGDNKLLKKYKELLERA